MSIITIEAVRPTQEQKERLIAETTRVASEILGVDQLFFYVLAGANDVDNWGVAGAPCRNFSRMKIV
ncbi:MAG: tautomerase family protein [Planctomycetia bacterium]|nr:tautomerase family protein [Planctomycetia bacterium]